MTRSQIAEAIAVFIERSSADPQNHWESAFNDLALQLFQCQFEAIEPYRLFCRARNQTPGNIRRWRDIPALPTGSFKEFEITTLPEAERTAVFFSSGTTQQERSRHFHSARSLRIYEVSLLRWFERHFVLDQKAKPMIVRLIPAATAAPHSSLAHMFEVIQAHFGAERSVCAGRSLPNQSWELDFPLLEAAFRQAEQSGRPVLVLATAFSWVHALDFFAAERMCFDLPAGSQVLETGGYKGRSRVVAKPELYKLIGAQFGIQSSHIVCEYGMSELSSQAYDASVGRTAACESGERLFRFPPWARPQIISPETSDEVGEGETGLLRIYDLANLASVLAVQTEDLAVRRGSGFELLGRAVQAEPRGCSLQSL